MYLSIKTKYICRKKICGCQFFMITKQPNRILCTHCKLQLVKPNGKSKHGFTKWHKYCSSCSKYLYQEKHKHLNNKKLSCEKCNFMAIDKCQLDLIYLDNNKTNKNKKNLLTLCANCSRLFKKHNKTLLDITVDTDIII